MVVRHSLVSRSSGRNIQAIVFRARLSSESSSPPGVGALLISVDGKSSWDILPWFPEVYARGEGRALLSGVGRCEYDPEPDVEAD